MHGVEEKVEDLPDIGELSAYKTSPRFSVFELQDDAIEGDEPLKWEPVEDIEPCTSLGDARRPLSACVLDNGTYRIQDANGVVVEYWILEQNKGILIDVEAWESVGREEVVA